jgi:hypothetical protein
MKLTIIVFAGREYCMELQLPYILKILNDNPNAEYHVWNFARNESDNTYLNTLPDRHNRIKIFNDYYAGENTVEECIKRPNLICSCKKCRVGEWSKPYEHYTSEEFKDHIFVKLDDDIVYLDLPNFELYLKTIEGNPEFVVSANVINNGACSFYNPIIKNKVLDNKLKSKDSTTYEWFSLCTNLEFLKISHDSFLSNEISNSDELIVFDGGKLSINTIGFNHTIMCEVSKVLSKLMNKTHDEKVFSSHTNILICQKFITSHLHFSDQNAEMSEELKNEYIKKYKELCSTII